MSEQEPLSIVDLAWLAGLFEGEGTVYWHDLDAPRLKLSMADEDVVRRAAGLFGMPCTGPYLQKQYGIARKKPMFQVALSGSRAIGWMLTMYSFLGRRRRDKIASIVSAWRERQPRPFNNTWSAGEGNGRAKLTAADVVAIRAKYASGARSYALAAEYGVSWGAIRFAVIRKTWKDVA